MGRKSNARALGIWSNGLRVGTWGLPARGAMELLYDPDWLDSPRGRPLSLSLPFPVGGEPLRGDVVENYFDNLLPDNQDIRRRLARQYTAGSMDTFNLLEALGRDCVGAVQLLPQDQTPTGFDRLQARPLSDEEVAWHLRACVSPPAAGQAAFADEFRISIAGAQEKTALLRNGGQWMLPQGPTPSTHILKMPLGLVGGHQWDLTTSVQNEWLCMKLLAAFGLDTAPVEMLTFADHVPVLSVTRFDRQMHSSGNWILRLPQEDFCQILGLPSSKKYEADGGPGIIGLAHILSGARNPRKDIKTLLSVQILFWMLAATDGHGKNFSIALHAGNSYSLTPLYDVLSAWPLIGAGPGKLALQHVKMAMAVSGKNRHYHHAQIQRRHFNATALRCGWGENCEDIIGELLARVEPAIAVVQTQIPEDFPQAVSSAIFSGLRESAQRLQSQPAS